MRKHFLLLMLMTLLPLAGFADELVGSTQYTNDGYQYKIKALDTDAMTGTVSVSQSNWAEKATPATAISIASQITINLKGEVGVTPVDGAVTFDVVEIAANGFKDLEQVTSISFASDCKLTAIGAGAFSGTSIAELDLTNTKITTLNKLFEDANTTLTSVTLPATLTTVVAEALDHCYALAEIDADLCTALVTLGANCFGDNVVTELDLSNTVVADLSNNPFVGLTTGTKNKTLTTLTLPATVTTLGTGLANLYNLTSVNLSSTAVTAAGDLAFENDKSLTSLIFPSTVTEIKTTTDDKEVFRGCAALTTLVINSANVVLGDGTRALFAEATAGDGTLSALTTLKIAESKTYSGTIAAASFDNCTGITTLEIAKGGKITGTLNAAAIALSNAANSTVTLGELGAAPAAGFIKGPVTAGVETTVTAGKVSVAQAQATAIISGNIGTFTVGALEAALQVEAIGAASKIVFGGNITVALTVAGVRVPNERLTEIDFGTIAITAAMFPAAAFDEVNAPNLTTATWRPTTATAAFAKATFGTADKDAAAKVQFTTNEAVAALYPNNTSDPIDDPDLYNVVFIFTAADAEPVAIKVYGPAGGSAFIGYCNVPAGTNYKIAKSQDGATITVYSAFIDESDNKLYMDPLQIVNGQFVVEKDEVVVVRSSSSADVKAYETADDNTMRYRKNSADIVNDLLFTKVAISADQLGTQYYDNGQYVYYLTNPATTGTINFRLLASNYFLPKNSVYTVRNGQAASAPELEIVWLDGSEDVTGIIERINNEKAGNNNVIIYNLAGQKVGADFKGIVIMNGKKMIRK